MFEKLEIVRLAQAMARHAGARTEVIAQNVANADTPGFRARDLPDFAAYAEGSGLRTTRAGHLRGAEAAAVDPVVTDGRGSVAPNGNTVSLEDEMVRSADAKREFDLSLSVMQSGLNLMRTAIGRRA